MMHKKTTISGH